MNSVKNLVRLLELFENFCHMRIYTALISTGESYFKSTESKRFLWIKQNWNRLVPFLRGPNVVNLI